MTELLVRLAIPLILIVSSLINISRFEGKRLPQSMALTMLVGASTFLGTQIEKGLFVNRHIDLCLDDTAAYYREYNGFDPYCAMVQPND